MTILLDGSGNCIEIEDGVTAIGSGGLYATSAARAMLDDDRLSAEEVARKSMTIAADLCIYTNHNFTCEVLESEQTGKNVLEKPKLGYWAIRGKGHQIKYLFAYLGIEFDDEVYIHDTSSRVKEKIF